MGRYAKMSEDARLYLKYRIHKADYDELFAHQGGVCALCKKPPTKGKKLVVDHDHTTGRVRGLLCNKCNLLLGRIENKQWIEEAKAYLLKPPFVTAQERRVEVMREKIKLAREARQC